ncbi:MAG: DUF120 domain-containing protein [Candidatus Aenigmarchaeota archaeon]|nr:DUF120 domain-containing protein [Candidatus Aenigmarchaeota archaeon]
MLVLKGKVVSGVMRGSPLIDTFFYRLIGILGFEPFKGTMDIQLERHVDVSLYSTKAIDHILIDGTKKVYAYLAAIILTIRKDGRAEDYNCWAIREPGYPQQDMLEIVAKDSLKDKFGLKDSDIVEITFLSERKRKKVPGAELFRRLYGTQTQMMKS